MILQLELEDREKATLIDALYTAETKYRYESSNLGDLAKDHARRIATLIEKVRLALGE